MTSAFDIEVAARTLAQEARGEPLDGQQAVAYVIKNRLKSGRWGKSLSSVCLWHAQFSGWWSPRGKPSKKDPNFAYACELPDGDATLSHMKSVLKTALENPKDPVKGALFYYSTIIPPPDWVAGMTFCCQIGRHKFYTNSKEPLIA